MSNSKKRDAKLLSKEIHKKMSSSAGMHRQVIEVDSPDKRTNSPRSRTEETKNNNSSGANLSSHQKHSRTSSNKKEVESANS